MIFPSVFRNRQKGAALVVALIMLILVTLIGLSAVNSVILELHISANEEERLLALQTAQAAIDEITAKASNFTVTGLPGDTVNCTSTLGCTNPLLTFTSPVLSADDKVAIVRIAPEEGNPPRLRGSEFSANSFRATFFQAEAEHNERSSGRARAKLVQGYMLLVPGSN